MKQSVLLCWCAWLYIYLLGFNYKISWTWENLFYWVVYTRKLDVLMESNQPLRFGFNIMYVKVNQGDKKPEPGWADIWSAGSNKNDGLCWDVYYNCVEISCSSYPCNSLPTNVIYFKRTDVFVWYHVPYRLSSSVHLYLNLLKVLHRWYPRTFGSDTKLQSRISLKVISHSNFHSKVAHYRTPISRCDP